MFEPGFEPVSSLLKTDSAPEAHPKTYFHPKAPLRGALLLSTVGQKKSPGARKPVSNLAMTITAHTAPKYPHNNLVDFPCVKDLISRAPR